MLYSPGCWHEACADPLTAAQTSQHWKPHQYWRTLIAAWFTPIYCRLLLFFFFLAGLDPLDFMICFNLLLSFPFVSFSNYFRPTCMLCSLTFIFMCVLLVLLAIALFAFLRKLSVVNLEFPVKLVIFKRLCYSSHNTVHSTSVIPANISSCELIPVMNPMSGITNHKGLIRLPFYAQVKASCKPATMFCHSPACSYNQRHNSYR